MANEPEITDTLDDAIGPDSIDDVVLESLPAPDRLPPMLFLAALVHGILIIGVTFNDDLQIFIFFRLSSNLVQVSCCFAWHARFVQWEAQQSFDSFDQVAAIAANHRNLASICTLVNAVSNAVAIAVFES